MIVRDDSKFFQAYAWACKLSDWFWGRSTVGYSYTDPYANLNFCSRCRAIVLVPFTVGLVNIASASMFAAAFIILPYHMFETGSIWGLLNTLLIVAGLCAAFVAGVFGYYYYQDNFQKRVAAADARSQKTVVRDPGVLQVAWSYAVYWKQGICPIIEIERTGKV